jgi:deoxyribodipyrimidine photo-lyase
MITTNYSEILQQVEAINPIKYGKTRNYLNGAVTQLSPYISRGVISTQQVLQSVLHKGYKIYAIEILIKELAWRDYYQQVWKALNNKINDDIKQPQQPILSNLISKNIVLAQTGIEAIDNGIQQLYNTGYIHNHVRMYVAALSCNIAQTHWLTPAQWMYYYLLDADWASNALSWQWVAGSFSNKKYVANQSNINTFCNTKQTKTFLDIEYSDFDNIKCPDELSERISISLKTTLPPADNLEINNEWPTYIYNFYNVDPTWNNSNTSNNILLLEPSFFEEYPVSDATIQFVVQLTKNIPHIQVFVGEFSELQNQLTNSIHFKEHPTNKHYKGIAHQRDWLVNEVEGYFPSFFSYWKKCEKFITKHYS